MEFYTYVNIFETKGLEYLLLLSFFALFIYLVRYLSGPVKEGRAAEHEGATPGREEAGVARTAARKRG
jgi:hypothetical protein